MPILALTARREAGDREPPRLVVNNYPLEISLIEFAAGAFKRQNGTAIEFEDLYLAYRKHCIAKNARAFRPAEAAQTNELCRECGIGSNRQAENGSWRTCNCQWRKCVA